MKRFLLILLLGGALVFPAACGEQPAEISPVAVLYTNDVHCAVDGNPGYAALAAYEQQLTEQGFSVLLADGGDAIQGAPIGMLSDGAYITDIMNRLGYDIAIPGNHEFDYGMEQFLSLAEAAEFDYISANFVSLPDGETVFAPYKILEAGGRQIAFVGATTPETVTSSTPAHFQNDAGQYIYGFCANQDGSALYAAVQTAVDEARSQGAEFVIALAHLGIDAVDPPWTSGDLIENTNGIDAVLDGHSHTLINGDKVKNKDGRQVLLLQTGTGFESIGKLTIAVDGTLSAELLQDLSPSDPEIQAYIDGILAEFNEDLGQVFAESRVDLVIKDPVTDVRIVRSAETNLGDLCADAFRTVGEADVALMNGGCIRAALPAGNITKKDLLTLFPFEHTLCVAEATGQEILDALELGVSALPNESGGFLQVSGLSYEIDMSVPSSVQLDENGFFVTVNGLYRVKNVRIGDAPLDPAKTYTVATQEFLLLEGGDGFSMFRDNKLVVDRSMVDWEVLVSFLQDHLAGVVGPEYADPYGEGRIVATE